MIEDTMLVSGAFQKFVKGLQDKWDSEPSSATLAAKLGVARYATVEVREGRKYWKVVMRTPGSSGSVYAFVDKSTGDIFKPASWKAPAKHARGSIFAADGGLGCCGQYSVAYLR